MSGQIWEVIGGATTNGIVVREGCGLQSAEVSRLSKGAFVEELQLKGERLHFRRISGDGPDTGWVSLKLKGKDLLARSTTPATTVVAKGSAASSRDESSDKYLVWVITAGSRGDVQPYAALACALQDAGYRIRFFANPLLEQLVVSMGLPFTAVALEFDQWAQGEIAALGMGEDAWTSATILSMVSTGKVLFGEEQPLPDLLIHNEVFWCVALAMWKKHGVSSLSACVHMPIMLQEYLENVYRDNCARERKLQSFTGVSPLQQMSFSEWQVMFCGRRQLFGFSRLMIATYPPEAQEQCKIYTFLGYWRMDPQAQAGFGDLFGGSELRQLREFIEDGAPPVCMGWGSMLGRSPDETVLLAVSALKLCGLRAVIVGGVSQLSLELFRWALDKHAGSSDLGWSVPEGVAQHAAANVLFTPTAPHEWLFPRCACTVHHGGVGTCHAAMAAGVPTVVTPIFADQFMNADWIVKLGNGIGMRELSAITLEELAAALSKATTDSAMRKRAQDIASQMSAEPGLAGSITYVNDFIKTEVTSGKAKRRWAYLNSRG